MQSQEQFDAARKEIESQGGIMSIAKKEAQRLEAQLNEAQKAARERAQAVSEEHGEDKGKTKDNEDGGKGKQKEIVEGEDGAAVDALEEKSIKKPRTNSKSEPMVTSTGEAIFDVDGDMTEKEKAAVDSTIQTAKVNAKTAIHNVQSFWDRIQADPRMNNIQTSLASTLKNISLPKAEATKDASKDEEDASSVSFADLSKQFQASFPHLNWKESQTIAKKYYDASENVARDWGKEMSNLMGDLVKIVPPEEQGQASSLQKDGVVKAEPSSMPNASVDDEDFDWDGDMDLHSASTGLQTMSGPETTSWEENAFESGTKAQGDAHDQKVVPAPAASKVIPSGKESKKNEDNDKEDEDEDSDWE